MQTKLQTVIFTPDLVQQVGNISRVLAEFLEKQTEATQKELEQRFGAVSPVATQQVLNAFATLEGTKQPLAKEEIKLSRLTGDQIGFVLDRLEKARLLREADGIYELAHDTLALRIAEQRSAEEIALLEVTKLVRDRYNAFKKTNTFLNQKEMQLVENQEKRLHEQEKLSAGEWKYLQDSRQYNRRKTRRTRLLIAAAMILLAAFSVYSFVLKNMADNKAEEARKASLTANFNLANLYDERANAALKSKNYQEAWLYTLEALNQNIDTTDRLVYSLGKLLLPALRPNQNHREGILETSASVKSMDLSAAGDLLAVGTAGNRIEIWDLNNNKINETLDMWVVDKQLLFGDNPYFDQREGIGAVALDPDGQYLVFSSLAAGKVQYNNASFNINKALFVRNLRDPGQYKSPTLLLEHTDAVNCIEYSPSGQLLASGSNDGSIILWDKQWKQKQQLQVPGDTINCLTFSPDGSLLASGHSKGGIKVWNVSDNSSIDLMHEDNSEAIRSVQFIDKGDFLASGSEYGTIIIWDIKNKKVTREWKAHNNPVISLGLSPEQNLLLSASDNTIGIWKRENGERAALLNTRGAIADLVFSRSKKQYFVGTLDKRVRLLDLELLLFDDKKAAFQLESFILNPPPSIEGLQVVYRRSFDSLPYNFRDSYLVFDDPALVEDKNVAYFGAKSLKTIQYDFVETNLIDFSNISERGYPKFLDDAIILAPDNVPNAGSAVFLKTDLLPPFEIAFEYSIDNGSDGSFGQSSSWKDWPADGFVFMFLKDRSTYTHGTVPSGSSRGFINGSGYGIHFATFADNDIFLMDGFNNLLASSSSFRGRAVNPPVFSDGEWRNVKVRVFANSVTLEYECEPALSWDGELDLNFQGIGFGAANGDASSQHSVRNVVIRSILSKEGKVASEGAPEQARITGNLVNVREEPKVKAGNRVMQVSKDDIVKILGSIVVKDENTFFCKKDAYLIKEDNTRLKDLGKGRAVTRISDELMDGHYYVETEISGKLVRGLIHPDYLESKSSTGEKWYKIQTGCREGWVIETYVQEL